MTTRRWRSVLAAACLGLAGAVVAAEPSLDDPTRPPAGVLGADGSLATTAGLGLTSVYLPRDGKPHAVIDGLLVRLGDRVRGARLTRVAETGVVLEGPAGIERLYLTPDVDKKTNVTRAAGARRNKE